MNSVYIHIPFCKSKCPYCDFYSYRCNKDEAEEYVIALIDEINTLRRSSDFLSEHFKADTLYLGGGTPSVLNGEQLKRIITAAKNKFKMDNTCEITLECNPSSDIESLFPVFTETGVNRISLGMQSAVDFERRSLGRTADKTRIKYVIELLKANGIKNISLDIMLGIPDQTAESLKETLDFAVSCGVQHISAYILKIEDGTFFSKNTDHYNFPDEDSVCDMYEQCSKYLRNAGFSHYEISNFALPGYESRHNTNYWELGNYLGIGAAAHSYIDGKRFYFESDSKGFIDGKKAVFDCCGGDSEEYIMLRLRLKNGLNLHSLKELYPEVDTEAIKKESLLLKEQGLVNCNNESISLTEKGYLVSNAVIARLI